MAIIQLTTGGEAVVDDEDYARLAGFPWRLIKTDNDRRYAGWDEKVNGKTIHHRLHRAVMGIDGTSPELLVDHRDRDGLNNRRKNLRVCTNQQNMCNSKKPSTNTSGFKGVRFHSRDRVFMASIKSHGKSIHLGTFGTAESAHQAYVAAAMELHGEFARFE
jgi:hypothetical protein